MYSPYSKRQVVPWKSFVSSLGHSFGCIELDAFRLDTVRQKHAYDIVKSLALQYDAIVTVSGDGLVHEVLNGFANHSDPKRAFAVPVAPIPTGSGNSLSLNLLGLEVHCHSSMIHSKHSHEFRRVSMSAPLHSMLSRAGL